MLNPASKPTRPASSTVAWALVVLWISASVFTTFANALESRRLTPVQGTNEPLPFSHDKHVSADWWLFGDHFEEHEQDCSGCHAVDSSGQMKPFRASSCDDCHITGFRQHIGETQLRDNIDEGQAFRHGEHGSLACADCHHPGPSNGSGPKRQLVVPDATRSVYCASCHASDGPGFQSRANNRTFHASELVTALNIGLEKRKLGNIQHFSHTTHIPGFAEGTPYSNESCNQCHRTALEGKETQWLPAVDAAECATTCHPGSSFAIHSVDRKSRWHDTFRHDVHLQSSHGLNCMDCHTSLSMDGKEFQALGGNDNASYEACDQCHQELSVSVPTSQQPPTTANHETETLIQCALCHQVPTGEVALWSAFSDVPKPKGLAALLPGSYTTHGQDHTRGQACTHCHLMPGDVRGKAKQDRAFSHASHIPANHSQDPSSGQSIGACTHCHKPFRTPQGMVEEPLGTLDLHVAVDQQACNECHGSKPIAVQVPPKRSDESGQGRFFHSDHDGKSMPDDSRLTCLTCHEGTPDVQGRIPLKIEESRCTNCHGHRDDAVDLPKALRLHDLANCQKCHTQHFPGIGIETKRSYLGFEVREGAGKHNPNGLENCATCHRTWTGNQLAHGGTVHHRMEKPSRVLSTEMADQNTGATMETPHYVHRDRGGQALRNAMLSRLSIDPREANQNYFKQLGREAGYPAGEAEHCLHCHWMNPRTQSGQRKLGLKESFLKTMESGPPFRIGLPGLVKRALRTE